MEKKKCLKDNNLKKLIKTLLFICLKTNKNHFNYVYNIYNLKKWRKVLKKPFDWYKINIVVYYDKWGGNFYVKEKKL